MSDVSSPCPTESNCRAFKGFAWKLSNVIAHALRYTGQRASTVNVRRCIADIEPLFIRVVETAINQSGEQDVWAQRIALVSDAAPQVLPRPFTERSRKGYVCYALVTRFGKELRSEEAQYLSAVYKYDRSYYGKAVSSISPLLEKLASSNTGNVFSTGSLSLAEAEEKAWAVGTGAAEKAQP